MQDYITEDTLKKVGVNLDGQDVASLLAHLNETLEERVGAEITDALDDSKLQVLMDLQDKATDEEVGAWLQENVPEFEQIIQDEIDILLGELVENTDEINDVAK
jgi:hypothetical protein